MNEDINIIQSLNANPQQLDNTQLIIPDTNIQQLDDTQIATITNDLNNQQHNEQLNDQEQTKKSKTNKYNKYIIRFAIILILYLLFSTVTVKKIFSNLFINLFPQDDNISFISLVVYGSLLSVLCVIVDYKLNDNIAGMI